MTKRIGAIRHPEYSVYIKFPTGSDSIIKVNIPESIVQKIIDDERKAVEDFARSSNR